MRHILDGYRAVIPRDTTPALFWSAIETTLSGGVFLPARPTPPSPEPPAELSPRQRQVLEPLQTSYDIKTISRRLALSPGTVKAHLAAVYRALGVTTRLQAVARAR
jgi:DNA-binding NarL/FixJ family response regulator